MSELREWGIQDSERCARCGVYWEACQCPDHYGARHRMTDIELRDDQLCSYCHCFWEACFCYSEDGGTVVALQDLITVQEHGNVYHIWTCACGNHTEMDVFQSDERRVCPACGSSTMFMEAV